MKTKVAITQMSCSSNYEDNIRKAEAMVELFPPYDEGELRV